MQMPLEIAFHNLDSSKSLEAKIRRKAAKLDALYERLIACRVRVELPHRQHQTGNIPTVQIEMSVPGKDLVVSNGPHHPEDYADLTIDKVLRDAFRAAERQLKAFKQQINRDVKDHESDWQMRGQVAQLYPQDDHGFLLTNTGSQLYFHRNSVLNGGFEKLKQGDVVHYIESVGDTGPTASKVRIANNE